MNTSRGKERGVFHRGNLCQNNERIKIEKFKLDMGRCRGELTMEGNGNSKVLCSWDLELEGWAKTAWRLKGSLMVAFLNQDLFLEFEIPKEAKWVLEVGRGWFRGDLLKLDWWRPDSGYVDNKENVREAWIRVVGLPLHLWRHEVLKKIGDNCGGFLAIDKETTLRVKIS